MIIRREVYLDKLRRYYNKQLIKVITGQRRVGKSYLLKQVKDDIIEKIPGVNIIAIDKEEHEFDGINNHVDLINYVKSKTNPKKLNVLLIDEVQEVDCFEKALRSLLKKDYYDIYCTGSNAQVFSGQLATILSGRQIEIRLHSLSYPEFIMFHKLDNNKDSLYRYIKTGGLPYLIHLPVDDEIVFDYLKNIYATILYRDVIARHNLRDGVFIENMLNFLANNTGNLISANSISNYMKSQNNTKTVAIILNYLAYLQQSYFISAALRYDIQGKKIFESGAKYYFEDMGLRNAIAGYKTDQLGLIIENIVYNHLRFLGFNVYVGKLKNNEVDFVAKKGQQIVYIQVAYLLKDKSTIDREFGNLLAINDNYPKYVVSMDDFPFKSELEGIVHYNLFDFLNLSL